MIEARRYWRAPRHGRVLRLALAAISVMVAGWTGPVTADGLKTYSKAASFDDVKFDLTNAITNRGLVVDFTGNVGGMLARTGKDVGSTKVIYKSAEYVSFCSAKLSREMMEADPANAGFCPYVIFLYELEAAPGKVVVGYRRVDGGNSPSSRTALAAVEALLEGIVKEAVK